MPEPALPETTPAADSSRAHGLAILRWLLLVAAAFGFVAAGMSWISRSAPDASPVAAPPAVAGAPDDGGDSAYPAPDFRLASLTGDLVGPPDFAGQAVVVEFWATWCGPCRLQARFLEQLHAELEGKPVKFLAINVGEDEATVREYVADTPFPYPVLLDPEDTLGPRYKIYGLPTVMIVDPRGAVSFLETGVSDADRLRHSLAAAGAEI